MPLQSFMQTLLATSDCALSDVTIVVDNAAIVHERKIIFGRSKSMGMAGPSHYRNQQSCRKQLLCRWDQKKNLDSALGAPRRTEFRTQRFHSMPNLRSDSLSLSMPSIPKRTAISNNDNFSAPFKANFPQKRNVGDSTFKNATIPIRTCASSAAVVHLDKQRIASTNRFFNSCGGNTNQPALPIRQAASFSSKPTSSKKMCDILGSLAPRSASTSERSKPKFRRTPTPAQQLRDATTASFLKEQQQALAPRDALLWPVACPVKDVTSTNKPNNASWGEAGGNPRTIPMPRSKDSVMCLASPSA